MSQRCGITHTSRDANALTELGLMLPPSHAKCLKTAWVVYFSTFFIATCHQIIATTICCCGKPSLPSATIAAMKTIKVLLRTPLPFDPPRWGAGGDTDGNNKWTPSSALMQSSCHCCSSWHPFLRQYNNQQ
jgi:hypothetical protein